VSAAPWSVKGIDPKAREVAKDLARRSGMTLGEWLNTMIMDDVEDDDGVVPLSRRTHAAEAFDRRGRSRRLDDVYGDDDVLHRVAASVDALAARLEAAERRSTVAIQGIDQAVSGMVRRLEGQEAADRGYDRRLTDMSEELREGHRRLRRFEQETGPKTAETFGKVESGLGALASRLYDIEERQRTSFNELRQRMETAEKAVGPGRGADALARTAHRLDQAQAQTTAALSGLERSFAELDRRLRDAEGRTDPRGSQDSARFEKLAETLARQVEASRSEMMRRLDTAEQENRMARLEAAVASAQEQVRAAEQRSAQGIESMGREVLRIAQHMDGRLRTLDGRIDRTETTTNEKIAAVGHSLAVDLGRNLGEKLDREMARHAQQVDHRLTRAEDQQALAIEKLGAEIGRISERLSDRIAQSERKSAQAIDDISRRLNDGSERMEQAYVRATGEFGERVRLSEERTAALVAEAKTAMEARAERKAGVETPAPVAVRPEPPAGTETEFRQPDWRAAAFPDETFEGDTLWADSPATAPAGPAPFPGLDDDAGLAPQRVVAEANPVDRLIAEMTADWNAAPETPARTPSAGFGGADVSDVLAVTTEAPAIEPASAFAAQAPAFLPVADTPDPLGLDALGLDAPGLDALGGAGPVRSDDTQFVDVHAMRAGLTAGVPSARAGSTQSTIDAARAAMAVAPDEEAGQRAAFGLKRGGKSRLQERLDKQSQRGGSTVRKTLLASATATALVGAVYVTGRLTGVDALAVPGLDRVLGLDSTATPAPQAEAPLLASAVIPTTSSPEAQALYDRAVAQIDAGDKAGLDTLTQAANLGMTTAQLKLAELYQSGSGGAAQSLSEARTWVRRAAEGDDPRGMHNYAMFLFDGVGGPKNRAESLNWLEKAANLGSVDSQFNAAKIYETGEEGVAANPTEALKWYLVAARTGDQPSREAADRLTRSMPTAGVRAAREAAAAFVVSGES
jgi:localization factor PodJL